MLRRVFTRRVLHTFPVIPNQVDTDSAQFKENEAAMRGEVVKLEQLWDKINRGNSLSYFEGGDATKHLARGKLLVRERIGCLLDANSPFLELSQLAGMGVYEGEELPAGGIVTGIGMIHSRPVMVVANDPTVKGGTYYPITVKKHLRAQEIAAQSQLPCVYLVDSGGAHLPHQAEVFPDRDHFGRIFYNQARLSAQGIPQVKYCSLLFRLPWS